MRPPLHARAAEPAASVPDSFEAAYRAHATRVTRWAARLGGPDIDLEDAVQEIFFVVSRRLGDFRCEALFTSWLYAITRKTVANQRRRRRLRRWLTLGAAERTPAPPAFDPGVSLEQRQATALFYRVVDGLPEKYRSVLVLFELEDLSTKEIAELCRLNVSTVKVRLHRARAMFLERHRRLQGRAER